MRVLLILLCFICAGYISLKAQANFWQKTDGPYGGVVRDLTVNSKGNMFACTDGGVFRALNHHSRWEMTEMILLPVEVILDIHILPSDVILVATWYGLLRSTDDGTHWNQSNLSWSEYSISGFSNDRFGRVYAASNHGILRSTDEGATWHIFALPNSGFSGILCEDDGRFVATAGSTVYVSTNSGQNWSVRPVPTSYINSLATNAGRLMVGTDYDGMLVSTDDGITWFPSAVPSTKINRIIVDPTGRIFACGNGIFVAQDYSGPWFSLGLRNLDVQSVLLCENEDMYASTWTQSVLKSSDNGVIWAEADSGLSSVSILSLLDSPEGDVYAGTINGYIYRSNDNGVSWTRLFSQPGYNISCLARNSRGNILAGVGVDMFISTDRGRSWTKLPIDFSENGYWYGPQCIAVDSLDNIFAGSSGGYIYKSSNNGGSWRRVRSANLGVDEGIEGIAASADGFLYAGTQTYNGPSWGEILRSSNGGDSWTVVGRSSIHSGVLAVVVDARGQVFVGTSGQGVCRSTDAGSSWSQVTPQFTYANNLATLNGKRLFATISGIVVASTNSGETWEELSSGLPTYMYIFDLLITGSGFPFVGTQNYGLLRGMRIVDSTLAVPTSFFLAQNYPNPFNSRTTIRFSLPKAGNVSLKVFNILGEEVAVLVDEHRVVGTYTVGWDAGGISSGVYLYQLASDGFVETKKLLLLK